jgi:hypothetical protein
MSANLGNGNITFGDGTTLSSAIIPITNITGVPTNLSQFTNNLGNYGGWLTSTNINTTPVTYPWNVGFNSQAGPMNFGLQYTGSGVTGKIWLYAPNCNCVCNC